MATESRISISGPELALFDHHVLDPEAAVEASAVLQENHAAHHIFLNPRGLHNHLVHQILTLYALGAPQAKIDEHYRRNREYQRGMDAGTEALVTEVIDGGNFMSHVGDKRYYSRFLVFFQEKIRMKGVEAVVSRYLFERDEVAEDLFTRLFTLHPLIHLACGIEFAQPAIVAEALAMTSTHDKSILDFLSKTEKYATAVGETSAIGHASASSANGDSLVAIIQAIHEDAQVRATSSWDEPRKFANGPLQKAEAVMLGYASRWRVGGPKMVEEKMAEIMSGAAFVAAAAQNPPKEIKFDFFLIHGITTAHGLAILLEQAWIADSIKVRLVEWMGRLLLAAYVGCGSPKVRPAEVAEYVPQHNGKDRNADIGMDQKTGGQVEKVGDGDDGERQEWETLVRRAIDIRDDGHAAKFVRGLMHGRKLLAACEDQGAASVVKGDMWLKICHMCLDSVEDPGEVPRWVRLAGFQEAWAAIPDRK